MNPAFQILGENGFSPLNIEANIVSTDRGKVLVRNRNSPLGEFTMASLKGFNEANTPWSNCHQFDYYLIIGPAQYVLLDMAQIRPIMDNNQPHRFALNAIGVPNGDGYRALPSDVGIIHSTVSVLTVEPTPETNWLTSIDYVGLTLLPTDLAGPGDIYEWRSSEGIKFISQIYSRQNHMLELGQARWVSLNDEQLGTVRILRQES